jgi:LDH2 family malate/lactate/ureidoglycolate dehydrogenase
MKKKVAEYLLGLAMVRALDNLEESVGLSKVMALSANIVSGTANEYARWWSVEDIGAVVDADGKSSYGFSSSF